MTNEELLANLMYEQCTKFYNNSIYVEHDGWTKLETIESFNANMRAGSKVDWFLKCVNNNKKYTYAFPRKGIASEVCTRIGYPWSENIGNIFYACYKGSVDIDDVYRYIALVDKNYEKVESIMDENAEQHFGSDKFKYNLNIYVEKVKNFLSTLNRNIYVENVEITEPCNKTNKFIFDFKFNKHLTYAQRKHFEKCLNTFFVNHYSNILAKANVCHYKNIRGIEFSWLEPKKCIPCDTYIIEIDSNNFLGIGIDPDCQFLPMMKKKFGAI